VPTPRRGRWPSTLGKTADRRALPWIGELLDDPEREIRGAGIDVLDRLLWGCEVDPDDCEALLRRAETDRDSQVRSAAARIREDVSRRRGIETAGTRGPAIATQRRETLVGLNATHYFSLVVARTFYHRGHRDRVLVQKASLSYGPKVERTLLRETFTDESDAVQETRRLAFDLAAYMAAQGVTPSLGIVRWVEDYDWGVDDDGLFIEDSATSPTRAIVVPMRTLRRLLPQVSRDTRVVEAFAESGAYFALLQEGRAAWHADVFQKLVPISPAAFGRASDALAAGAQGEPAAPRVTRDPATPAAAPTEPAFQAGATTGIDWRDLSRQVLGARRADAGGGVSSGDGQRAVELIIGEARLRRAVDDYLAGHPAGGLIRAVLALVGPLSAMVRCVEACRAAPDVTTREAAVELLTAIGDRGVLPWIDELQGDPDDEIRARGLEVLDALLRADVVWPEDCEERLPRVADHPDSRVRAGVTAMQEYLARLPL